MEMPEVNFIAILVAAIIPSILGAIYYGPLFEKQWLSSIGKTKEEMVPNNMPVTYGLALLMALLAATSLKYVVEFLHRGVDSSGELTFASFHTFGHGAFHGLTICLSFVVPIIVSLSLFHKASGKNIILNVIFWLICFAIMGGILDVWN